MVLDRTKYPKIFGMDQMSANHTIQQEDEKKVEGEK